MTVIKKVNSGIMYPIATASWLIDNTSLTFEQIAKFCDLYSTEITSIADGLIGNDIIPFNPILSGTLTQEEIKRCESNPKSELANCFKMLDNIALKKIKQKKYTPMMHKRNRPDAILWLTMYANELSDLQIIKLVKTTKNMIESIKSKTYRDYANLVPKDPVIIGFCTQKDLNIEIAKAKDSLNKANEK